MILLVMRAYAVTDQKYFLHSIAENSTKVRALKGNWQETSTSPAAQKRLSMSHDSLNASAQSQ